MKNIQYDPKATKEATTALGVIVPGEIVKVTEENAKAAAKLVTNGAFAETDKEPNRDEARAAWAKKSAKAKADAAEAPPAPKVKKSDKK